MRRSQLGVWQRHVRETSRCFPRSAIRFGFETVEIEPVEIDGELVSSTRIRKAVEAGDFETARRFLGRDYTILGTVQPGAGRGRGIGFPTANLSAHNERFPPNGVYAVRVLMDSRWLEGVANVGVRPTVGSALDRVLEVHIFDFSGDRYGHDLEVKFERFLRPEKKFSSIEELRTQIARDAALRARDPQFAAFNAARMTSSGAALPNQISKDSAPWCRSIERPLVARAPAASASSIKARLSRCVDGVIDHEVRREQSGRDQWRIGASHTDGGGVDDEVGLGELFAERALFKAVWPRGVRLDQPAGRCESRKRVPAQGLLPFRKCDSQERDVRSFRKRTARR